MFGCQTTKKVFYSTIQRLSGMKKNILYNFDHCNDQKFQIVFGSTNFIKRNMATEQCNAMCYCYCYCYCYYITSQHWMTPDDSR